MRKVVAGLRRQPQHSGCKYPQRRPAEVCQSHKSERDSDIENASHRGCLQPPPCVEVIPREYLLLKHQLDLERPADLEHDLVKGLTERGLVDGTDLDHPVQISFED